MSSQKRQPTKSSLAKAQKRKKAKQDESKKLRAKEHELQRVAREFNSLLSTAARTIHDGGSLDDLEQGIVQAARARDGNRGTLTGTFWDEFLAHIHRLVSHLSPANNKDGNCQIEARCYLMNNEDGTVEAKHFPVEAAIAVAWLPHEVPNRLAAQFSPKPPYSAYLFSVPFGERATHFAVVSNTSVEIQPEIFLVSPTRGCLRLDLKFWHEFMIPFICQLLSSSRSGEPNATQLAIAGLLAECKACRRTANPDDDKLALSQEGINILQLTAQHLIDEIEFLIGTSRKREANLTQAAHRKGWEERHGAAVETEKRLHDEIAQTRERLQAAEAARAAKDSEEPEPGSLQGQPSHVPEIPLAERMAQLFLHQPL